MPVGSRIYSEPSSKMHIRRSDRKLCTVYGTKVGAGGIEELGEGPGMPCGLAGEASKGGKGEGMGVTEGEDDGDCWD